MTNIQLNAETGIELETLGWNEAPFRHIHNAYPSECGRELFRSERILNILIIRFTVGNVCPSCMGDRFMHINPAICDMYLLRLYC